MEDSKPATPPQISEWDGTWVQLWKARVRVEHVLKGQNQPQEVDIFYFPNMGPGESAWSRIMTIRAGQFEMFFLQPDNGRLRTVCDGWAYCMFNVRTGSHKAFQVDRSSGIEDLQVDPLSGTVEDLIVQFLLTRGEKTTDQQLIEEIRHPQSLWGTLPVFNALTKLAQTEKSPAVQAVISDRLKQLQAEGLKRVPSYGW